MSRVTNLKGWDVGCAAVAAGGRTAGRGAGGALLAHNTLQLFEVLDVFGGEAGEDEALVGLLAVAGGGRRQPGTRHGLPTIQRD